MRKMEMEYCVACQIDTEQFVHYTKRVDGVLLRKGECGICGVRRALPHNVPAGSVKMHFGKHKGACLKDIPRSYLEWLLDNVDLNYSLRNRINIVLGEQLAAKQDKWMSYSDGEEFL